MNKFLNDSTKRKLYFGQKIQPTQFVPQYKNNKKIVTVNIWRNIGVEYFLPIINDYLQLENYEAKFSLSFYDSSIDLRNYESADLDIIYQEINRENVEGIVELIQSKVSELEERGAKFTALVFQIHKDVSDQFEPKELQKIFYPKPCEIIKADYAANLETFFQPRLLGITGNWLAPSIAYTTARSIASKIILPLFVAQTKVIAIDLDNTLYQGILAEDGIRNLKQSENQTALIQHLRELKKKGVMICLVTRNHAADVDELLLSQNHIGLSLQDFDFVHATWEPKENIIVEILRITRVGQDALLFIDDSPIEILRVEKALSNVKTLLFFDENETLIYLKHLPSLQIQKPEKESKIDRVRDLVQNEKRMSIFQNLDDAAAHKELGVSIKFHKNDENLIPRAAELSRKTNQFNANLKRYSEIDVKRYLTNPRSYLVTTSLRDNLADSGIVSIMIAQLEESNSLRIDEFCISCRALGRGLESEVFFGSIKEINQSLDRNVQSVLMETLIGPRNAPFFDWARQFLPGDFEGGTMLIGTEVLNNWASNLG